MVTTFRIDSDAARQFGADVRAARLASGNETQAALAARCVPPLRQARLSWIEHGRARISEVEVRALRTALPVLDVLIAIRHRQPLPPRSHRPLTLGQPAGRFAPASADPDDVA